MKLLVDIGNTRIKWLTLDKNGLSESHHFERTKTGIKASLNKAWKTLEDIKAVYVSNVAGDKIATQLTEWTEKYWQLAPHFISTEQKRFGVINAYDNPEKLGVDRWLALIAARQHARQAQCVIDCGTAITVDIVTKTGQHQGGMILPGLSLMRQALSQNTAALSDTVDENEFKTLATNTHSAIQAGTLYTVTATLENLIADLKQSFKDQIRFIITGGDVEELIPLVNEKLHHYPDIVLKGLAFYARQDNRKSTNTTSPDDNEEDDLIEESKQKNDKRQTEITEDEITSSLPLTNENEPDEIDTKQSPTEVQNNVAETATSVTTETVDTEKSINETSTLLSPASTDEDHIDETTTSIEIELTEEKPKPKKRATRKTTKPKTTKKTDSTEAAKPRRRTRKKATTPATKIESDSENSQATLPEK